MDPQALVELLRKSFLRIIFIILDGFCALKSCNPDCPVQTPNRASGPKWEKNGRKMDFGPTGKKGQKWPKNGKIAIFGPIFPFFGHFCPFFPVGPNGYFSAIFWGLYRAIWIATQIAARGPLTEPIRHLLRGSLLRGGYNNSLHVPLVAPTPAPPLPLTPFFLFSSTAPTPLPPFTSPYQAPQ